MKINLLISGKNVMIKDKALMQRKDNSMDHRRWTDWDARCPHKEDSTNNPYYNQPTHSPYRGQGFAIASVCCGISSMLFTCMLFVPIVLAAFGFLFAALAYRKGRRRNHLVTNGMLTSFVGIISAIIMIFQIFAPPADDSQTNAYQQMLQQYMEQMQ